MSFPIKRTLDLCEARGMKPARVCARAGLSADYIRNLERGTVLDPSLTKLAAIADVLETNPLYLAELTDDPRPTKERDLGRALTIEGRAGLGLWYDERSMRFARRQSMIGAAPGLPGRQFSLLMDDDSMEALPGLGYGAQLHCLEVESAAVGELVVLKRTSGALTELSARLIADGRDGLVAITQPLSGPVAADPLAEAGGVIVARVLGAYVPHRAVAPEHVGFTAE